MAHAFDSGLNIGGNAADSAPKTGGFGGVIGSLKQPMIVLSHVGFRTLAVGVYLFAGLFSSSTYIAQFVTILILLSIDFWVVKNITGRLLAGVRWWTFIDANGDNHWKFETAKEPERYNSTEVTIFWTTLFATPLVWLLLIFTAFISFRWLWMAVAVVALAMSGTNLYGYLRCRWSSTTAARDYMLGRFFTSGLSGGIMSRVFNRSSEVV